MNDLPTRVRNYLDSLKGIKPTVKQSVEPEVPTEVDEMIQAWKDVIDHFRPALKVAKAIAIILACLVVMWSMAIVSIHIDCLKNKECREWMK